MKGYVLIPQCRVCSRCTQEIRDLIDADLIANDPILDVLNRYKEHFTGEYPLTENSLINHKKHLVEWLAVARLSAIKIEGGRLSLVPEVVKRAAEVDSFIRSVSVEVAKGVVNEDKILQNMILDSYRDIERLNDILTASALNPKYLRSMILTKDTVKKNLIDTLQKNTELRQKIGGDIDKANTVKDIVRRVIMACVKSLRTLGVTQEQADEFAISLKDMMSKDTEISKYMDLE